jgi:uncharacterized protein YecT (DUF1311 family)
MKTLVASVCILALLTGVAFAQEGRAAGENSNTKAAEQDSEIQRAQAEQKKQKELDAAYKAALTRTKTPTTAPSDPWGDVRPTKPSAANR